MDPNGYYEKFTVTRNSTGEQITGFRFVLLLNDEHARRALLAYADSCESENPTLANDLRDQVRSA